MTRVTEAVFAPFRNSTGRDASTPHSAADRTVWPAAGDVSSAVTVTSTDDRSGANRWAV